MGASEKFMETAMGLMGIIAGLLAAAFAALVAYAVGLENLWRNKRETQEDLNRLSERIKQSDSELDALLAKRDAEFTRFSERLNDDARELFLELPEKIRNILREINFQRFLKEVEDPSIQPTIFDFYGKRSETQRQIILLEEPRILTLSSLGTAETLPSFCNIFWLLGVFYASAAYSDGYFLESPNLRRGILYLERAQKFDPQNDRPVDDLGLVLLNLKTEDSELGIDKAIDLLTHLIEKRKAEGRPALQRAVCNLAWAHMGRGRRHPEQLADELNTAMELVKDDAVLSYPFRIPGRSDPGIVLTVRACILAQQSLLESGSTRKNLLLHAMDNLNRAAENALPSVKRVIDEETSAEGRDLWPLVTSEFGPELRALKERL